MTRLLQCGSRVGSSYAEGGTLMEWLQRAQVDVSASLHGHTLIGL